MMSNIIHETCDLDPTILPKNHLPFRLAHVMLPACPPFSTKSEQGGVNQHLNLNGESHANNVAVYLMAGQTQ